MQDRNHEWIVAVAIDDLADDVGALVTVKQIRQCLYLVIGFQRCVAQYLAQPCFDMRDVAVEIGKLAGQLEIGHHAPQRVSKAVARRIINTVVAFV